MSQPDVDVVILGSGFGGSLTSLVLSQLGKRCLLVDRATHPRFAVGESSTPLADFVLSHLARTYDLPELLPLASFGTWRQQRSELQCGLKRGFTYFRQEANQPFEPLTDNSNQLLVTASPNNDDSDTHWLRADVDHFLFELASSRGVECLQACQVREIARDDASDWNVTLDWQGHRQTRKSRFIIDATGHESLLATKFQTLGIQDESHRLQTQSRAIFSHFSGVDRFEHMLSETHEHPYRCDDAALHHVFDDGWMWNLRFQDDTVSAGFVLSSLHSQLPAQAEWTHLLDRFPSIARQFSNAVIDPGVGLRSTGRLQRLASVAAGPGWATLPGTAGFVDPLHSTGIAHTLASIERLAAIFECGTEFDANKMADYSDSLREEIRFIDELVSGCYAAMHDFSLFTDWCMLYFAAAITCEERRAAGHVKFADGFLCAKERPLRDIVASLRTRLDSAIRAGTEAARKQFREELVRTIQPYNTVGLCDPACRNMYRYTAAPRGLGTP